MKQPKSTPMMTDHLGPYRLSHSLTMKAAWRVRNVGHVCKAMRVVSTANNFIEKRMSVSLRMALGGVRLREVRDLRQLRELRLRGPQRGLWLRLRLRRRPSPQARVRRLQLRLRPRARPAT